MKVQILSHDEAVAYLPNSSQRTAIIRLFDSEAILSGSDIRNESLQHELSFEKVFTLVVDDIQRDLSDEYPGVVLFNKEHADHLIQVFQEIRNMDEVIVHCRAGVSRSAAVAILFVRYLQRLDLECSLYLKHSIYPNRHILSFQSEMGIEKWNEDVESIVRKMEQQVIAGDHESIVYSVKKLGYNWEELV